MQTTDIPTPINMEGHSLEGLPAKSGSQFFAGDFVHHGPSGEDWVLACDEEKGEVLPSGWPMCIAKASDCTLQQQATPEQRLEILTTWAAPHPDAEGERDWRTITARRQLSTANTDYPHQNCD